MAWHDDLIHIAAWALQKEDLRHRYLHADSPQGVTCTPGLAWCLETVAVLSIYEAALGKGYLWNKTIGYESEYPNEEGKTPKRADLIFKDGGPGQSWAYVEVKCYGDTGKSSIGSDIEKLKSIQPYNQRWMLVYRIRKNTPTTSTLKTLLTKNFGDEIKIHAQREFPTFTNDWEEGVCDICLFKIL